MPAHDITFVGHMCYDEIVPYQGERAVAPGSAVLCGALAAARIGCRVRVVTKMAPGDEVILKPMREVGVQCDIIPASETSRMEVLHPVADVDVREMRLLQNAQPIQPAELPPLDSTFVHLAGISDQEFPRSLIAQLKGTGVSLSADMQSFVRQVDPADHLVRFADVPDKADLVQGMARLKLDVLEAELLTGTKDLEAASATLAEWGCPEVVITQAEGVLARVDGTVLYERFTNRSVIGRTGRGDTTSPATWLAG